MNTTAVSDKTAQFLALLHRGGVWGYWFTLPEGRSHWWKVGNPLPIPQAENVYFGVHPTSQPGTFTERSKNETVCAINCLYADLDRKSGADLDKLLESIDAWPSAIIESGGGWHCYWILREPFILATDADRDRAARLQAAWVKLVGGDPGAKDLARVLRVPGTMNGRYGTPRPVTILQDNFTLLHDINYLESLCTPTKGTQKAQEHNHTRISGGSGEYWLKQAILRASVGTRNATGFWLALMLRDDGMGESEAGDVMRSYAAQVPGQDYDEREALASLRSAYSQSTREPAMGKIATFTGSKFSSNGHHPAAADEQQTESETESAGSLIELVRDILPKPETGEAELFAALHAGNVCFDHKEGAWYFWTGHYWRQDSTRKINRQITGDLPRIIANAAIKMQGEDNGRISQELFKRAAALYTRKRQENVLYLAASRLAVEGEEWDRDPWLLACENGIIDLRTGQLSPGRPGDYIRAHAPLEWQGLDAPAPRFAQFITEIFNNDREIIDFMPRLLGYGITGLTQEHILPILWGEDGRNGKGTLLETLGDVLGNELAISSQADALMDMGTNSDAPRPFVYALRGKRFVWASESNEGRRINAGLVKQLTGGDRLNVRTLHTKPVEFLPSHLLVLLTNHRPHISADDQAIWDRIILLPFLLRFIDDPQAPNERQRDKALRDKLRAEAPGILAWLVRGCLEWQRVGLAVPEKLRQATQEYRMEEDDLAHWREECCIIGSSYEARGAELYSSYSLWCQRSNLKPMNQTAFGRRMGKQFAKKVSNGIVYSGLGLVQKTEGFR